MRGREKKEGGETRREGETRRVGKQGGRAKQEEGETRREEGNIKNGYRKQLLLIGCSRIKPNKYQPGKFSQRTSMGVDLFVSPIFWYRSFSVSACVCVCVCVYV